MPSPFERAQETLRRANDLDPSNPVAIFTDAYYLYLKRDPRFFDRVREAVSANPRDSFTLAFLGQGLVWAGKPAEGLAMVERAIELDPIVPGWFFFPFSTNAFLEGDYIKGLAYAKKINIPGFHWNHINLAIQYAGLEELEKAREQAELIRQSFPNFEIHAYTNFRIFIWDMDEIETMIAALRIAGMEIPDEE